MKFYAQTGFIFLTMIIGLSACKSSKSSIADADMSKMTDSEYFEKMLNNELQYESLLCKMSVDLKMSINPKGSIKLIKDKVLQISLSVPIIGSELFRMTVTPDSIIAIDRVNQQYVAEDISVFKAKNADVDFNTLQSLFANRLFIPGKSEVAKADYSQFNMNRKDNQMLLKPKGNKKLNYTFAGNTACKITSAYIETATSDYRMEWKYSDFGSVDGTRFPFKMNIDVTGNKKMSLVLSFSQIEKDTDINIDYSVPAKYRRVDIDDLLKMLTK